MKKNVKFTYSVDLNIVLKIQNIEIVKPWLVKLADTILTLNYARIIDAQAKLYLLN